MVISSIPKDGAFFARLLWRTAIRQAAIMKYIQRLEAETVDRYVEILANTERVVVAVRCTIGGFRRMHDISSDVGTLVTSTSS